MANRFVVRDTDRGGVRRLSTYKGEVEPVTVDFSPWAEDNGTVSTVTWSVKAGSATISGQALASNSASAVITTASEGGSLIEVKGSGATHTKILNLRVYARDPVQNTNDYGFSA